MEQFVEDDESWWNGVEIVDITQEPLWEDEMSCDQFGEFCEAFPSFVPPPPAPPFMLSALLEGGVKTDYVNEDECIMCNWINSNSTSSLLPNTETPEQRAWISILVIVAFTSAMIGAFLMIFFLRCKRLKVLPSGGDATILPVGYTGPANKDPRSESNTMNSRVLPCACGTLSATHICARVSPSVGPKQPGWRGRWWQKVSRNQSEQHDNPYAMVDDRASAVYAELNSIAGSVGNRQDLYHGYLSNMYSEIPDIPLHALHRNHHPIPVSASFRRMLQDNAYENATSQQTEPQCPSSGCPSSTSSSAYYSDLSNPEQCSRTWSSSRTQRPPCRSCSTCHRQSRAHMQPVFSIAHCHPPHCAPSITCTLHAMNRGSVRGRDLMPVALDVIPDNVAVDPQLLQNLAPNLNQSRNIDLGDVYDYSDNSVKRPLPPLPSRQSQGPQRRFNSNNMSDGSDRSELSQVPSQYV